MFARRLLVVLAFTSGCASSPPELYREATAGRVVEIERHVLDVCNGTKQADGNGRTRTQGQACHVVGLHYPLVENWPQRKYYLEKSCLQYRDGNGCKYLMNDYGSLKYKNALSQHDLEEVRKLGRVLCFGEPIRDSRGYDKTGEICFLGAGFYPRGSADYRELAIAGCRTGSKYVCQNIPESWMDSAEKITAITRRSEEEVEIKDQLREERLRQEAEQASRRESTQAIVSALNQATAQIQHQNDTISQQQQLILQQQALRDHARIEQKLESAAAISGSGRVVENRPDPYYRGPALDSCITTFFGEKNKFAVRNDCSQKVFVNYMARLNPVAVGQMGLEPGEYKYTGDVGQLEINKFGGYAFAVCPWGHKAVEQATPTDKTWRNPGVPYLCRKLLYETK